MCARPSLTAEHSSLFICVMYPAMHLHPLSLTVDKEHEVGRINVAIDSMQELDATRM